MPREPRTERRRVCFVTGTRAEFGLMQRTLAAIRAHPKLQLQVIATGMHLNRTRGMTLRNVMHASKLDHIVPWDASANDPVRTAKAMGIAISKFAYAFDKLKTDIVLIVGDRVEAFAAASAGHVAGKIVAHVHGGDRALGQVDDSLRHAITKLSHVHFPATKRSASRIIKLGEDCARVNCVGSPAIDGIRDDVLPLKSASDRFALIVLHPADADALLEYHRAKMVLRATLASKVDRAVIVLPNNDPGSEGIVRAWRDVDGGQVAIHTNLSRSEYLGLLAGTSVLVGNSSSGIIEAASFDTPVVDIGRRQLGRERGANVVNVPYSFAAIRQAVDRAAGRRFPHRNIYGGTGTGRKIAAILARVPFDQNFRRKLIAY